MLVPADNVLAKAPDNGVQKAYHSNGRLWVETRYKDKKIILRRQYSDQGALLLDYRYKNGEPYYKRTSYPDGRILSLWTKKSGMLINYKRDGSIKAQVESAGLNIEQP